MTAYLFTQEPDGFELAETLSPLKKTQSAPGKAKHRPTYWSWWSMRRRCYAPSCNRYENYGGKGIRVCVRWVNSFDNFVADMGLRPDGCVLDRKDPKRSYYPDNCRWVTVQESNRNRATVELPFIEGETKTSRATRVHKVWLARRKQ